MDAALLGLRVVLALACVLGLIWFTGRRLQGTTAVRKQRSVPLAVLGRQSLGKGAGIALVEVAGRVLLLGVGEQGVRVLTEVDVPVAPAPAPRGAEVREEIDLSTLPEVAPVAALVAVDAAEPVVAAPVAAASVAAEAGDDADVPAADDVDGDALAPVAEVEAADDVDADADVAPDAAVTAVTALTAVTHGAGDVLPTPHADGTARLAALAGLAAGASSAEAGALRGSVLSPDTWRRTVDVVQRRTARR